MFRPKTSCPKEDVRQLLFGTNFRPETKKNEKITSQTKSQYRSVTEINGRGRLGRSMFQMLERTRENKHESILTDMRNVYREDTIWDSPPLSRCDMNRRNFLAASGSCAAHLLALSCVSPAKGKSIFLPQQEDNVVVTEKWGRLEEVAKGAWAHIATPFETKDFTTLSNGGIIMGKERVLAIEAFMQPKGATWLAEQAKTLTGRWPTDIVVTHFHGDHCSGHEGYFVADNKPTVWLTESTQTGAESSFEKRRQGAPAMFDNVKTLSETESNEIDLGGRTVTIVPRQGHTNSDVSIEISDPKIIWTGDLFFNRMFPNYSDAMPGKLNEYAAELVKLEDDVVIVPGHGPLANTETAEIYVEFLNYVQTECETAIKAGKDIKAAAAEFKLPENLNDWFLWSPQNALRAFKAWERELKAAQ